GMIVPKGEFTAIRAAGLPTFRERIGAAAPFLSAAAETLKDWNQVKLLSVQLDRLPQWSVPGLLCIGDAAHAMSPVFGVGVNYAGQDAVAAARLLSLALLAGVGTGDAMRRVQRRREWPVRLMQPLQQRVHTMLSNGGIATDVDMSAWQARLATLVAKAAQPVT